MKTPVTLALRKIKHHIPQLVGLLLLIGVGTLFLVTIFTIKVRYKESSDAYFAENAYADATYYGLFNDSLVNALAEEAWILEAEGRVVQDIREGDKTFRTISLTENLNQLHIYQGRLPDATSSVSDAIASAQDTYEAAILKRNAESMGLAIGDTFKLGDRNIEITAIVSSPEYIYLIKNQRTLMADPEMFGVLFLDYSFFDTAVGSQGAGDSQVGMAQGAQAHTPWYNEIVVRSNARKPVLQEYANEIGAPYMMIRDDQPNTVTLESDLEQIETFAFIFPIIFAILVVVIIVIMVSRTIQRDRKQIGTMKALGSTRGNIATVYLVQFGMAGFLGALVGCLSAIPTSNFIIGVLTSMFEVPGLHFVYYQELWFFTIGLSTLLCVVAGWVSLLDILRILPAKAMISKPPKSGKNVLLELTPLWRRFSFNTRYAVKSAMRNKGRFLAVILGMTGSCALMVFSIGFYNSLDNMQVQYFDSFADYDLMVTVPATPLAVDQPIIEEVDAVGKALMIEVDVQDESYVLTVLEDKGFDFLDIPLTVLDKGLVLPEHYADLWGVSEGDTITVDDWEGEVSAVITQYMGLTIYTSYDYMQEIRADVPQAYNTLFGRDANVQALEESLHDQNLVYATIDEDRETFESLMRSLSILVWFLIACSLLLGVVVLYSVGLINLSSREYEYMFMGVMGYRLKSIMSAHIKETIWHIIISVPIGFLLGNVILEGIKSDFSTPTFALVPAIYPIAYIIGASSVILVTIVMAVVMAHAINNLDIVQGLKAQDE